jgi:SPW repeat
MHSCQYDRGSKEVVDMKAWTRWQDWASLVLGVLLFIAPWVFGTATNGASSWDVWIVGAIGVILALWALSLLSDAVIPEWISLILGVWLFISPWILGFATLTVAAWTAWILGILFVVVNGWTLLQTRNPRVGATA